MADIFKFSGSRTEQPATTETFEPGWKRRERLASRDRAAVQHDMDRHVAARRAYKQALARATLLEEQNLPAAQIGQAHEQALEAYTETTEAARAPLVVMPTDVRALVDLLLYLEKNFSLLPPDIASGASNGQSLAFSHSRPRAFQFGGSRSTVITPRITSDEAPSTIAPEG